jgi:hypothetical protein
VRTAFFAPVDEYGLGRQIGNRILLPLSQASANSERGLALVATNIETVREKLAHHLSPWDEFPSSCDGSFHSQLVIGFASSDSEAVLIVIIVRH